MDSLVAGDGKRDPDNGHITLRMVARDVIYAVRLLIARLGFAGRASEGVSNGKPIWMVTWSPDATYRRHGINSDFLFLPLKEIQERPYEGPVFNLEVAEDNSYVTDIALHNCEVYVAPGKRTDREAKKRGEAGYHLTLLAKDISGFRNLIKMASAAFLEGYYYVPRIDKELLQAHSEGLICLSGCASAEFSELILKEQLAEAKKLAAWFAGVFPGASTSRS